MVCQAAWHASEITAWLSLFLTFFSHSRSGQLLKQNAIFSFSVLQQMTGFIKAALEQEVRGQVGPSSMVQKRKIR